METCVYQLSTSERLFILWRYYLQLCEKEGQLQGHETELFGNQFIEKLWSDTRLKDYTWFVVDEETFHRKETTEDTCRVYALGSVEEATVHDLVEKFVIDVSESAVDKEIYVHMPLILTTPLSEQKDLLLNKKMWATWISVF